MHKCLICNILTISYYLTVVDVSIIPQWRILDYWSIKLEKIAAYNFSGGLLQSLGRPKHAYRSNFDEVPLGRVVKARNSTTRTCITGCMNIGIW